MATSQGQQHQPVRGSEPALLIRATDQMASDVEALSQAHGVFAELIDRNGIPPLWLREASFATLVRFVLEQQVSLASANAAFRRLDTRLGGVAPEGVLASSDAQLKLDGFSRQKADYVRGIADEVLSGDLKPPGYGADPQHVQERLLKIKGIGPWTASCYVLFVCGAADSWPTGDRALYVSMAKNLELVAVPDRGTADRIASAWAPWRSSAAKMLWYDYLGGRSYVPTPDAGFIGGSGKVQP